MSRPPISAFVITKNEEKKIKECLDSLAWAAEIVVVDDFSTDGTAEICRQNGGVVFHQHPFAGFREQKEHAMALCSHRWVLEIDADERVSDGMREKILGLPEEAFLRHAAFAFKRLTCFWGKWIRHAGFYPDYKVRLYDRQRGGWSGGTVHERFIPSGPVKKLDVDIIHDQDLDLGSYLQRTSRYAYLSASDYLARGRRARWHHVSIRPLFTFFYRYVFRRGFLDGAPGFVISVMGGIGTFVKYMRLFELQNRPDSRSE